MDASITNLELHDFIDEANFEQFIDLIRGENEDPIANFGPPDYDFGLLNDTQFGPTTGDMFDYNFTTMVDPNCVISTVPSMDGEMNGGDDQEENDGEDSSETTTTTTTTTNTGTRTSKTKVDRSRTLVSERRRRGRMKEKLYALRSLVPNITKMDKASIVGDAVLYVQDMQKQAKKLKAEIAGLEASLVGADQRQQGSIENQNTHIAHNGPPICKKIIVQIDVFQVEERGFYVRLVCNKGQGLAASLYKALESLTGFNVQSSNLAAASERFVLTFTLTVKECGQDMNLPNLKLWVTGALLNQGFEFRTPLST